MDAIIKILREFPAIWAFIGVMATAVLWFAVGRKITPIYSNAVGNLSKVYELQINAHKAALEMQKEHYDAEIADIKGERDNYREKLHAEKESHQGALLQISELQARPDVKQLYDGQKDFFSSMTIAMTRQGEAMSALQKAILDHDKGLEARTAVIMEPIAEMCRRVTVAVEHLKI